MSQDLNPGGWSGSKTPALPLYYVTLITVNASPREGTTVGGALCQQEEGLGGWAVVSEPSGIFLSGMISFFQAPRLIT